MGVGEREREGAKGLRERERERRVWLVRDKIIF